MKKLAMFLGGALALASCSTTPPPPPDMNNVLLAPGFLAHAVSANTFEIQSAQLALQSGVNPSTQNFASMLITDHNMMGQQIATAAAEAHVAMPPPALLPADQAALDQLRASGTGASFNLAFLQAQINAHQQGISLMQNYSANGDVPALRSTAAGAIPVMQKHLQIAQSLAEAPPPPPPPPAPLPSPPPPGRAGERG